MFSKVLSGTVHGIEGFMVEVEADVSDGLPMFEMVGYLAFEVKEAKERVRTAIRNSMFPLPSKRITINLSPADIRKEGSAFDLPIAVAILCSLGYIPCSSLVSVLIIGELSLNGEVKQINGVLPLVHHAQKQGVRVCIVPWENSCEGAVIKGIDVIGVRNLLEVVEFLNNNVLIEPEFVDLEQLFSLVGRESDLDFSDVRGQEMVKRAVEVAVAGYHNILLIGPPGAGKSMIAKRIPSIMPPLCFDESLELTKIYSVNGLLKSSESLVTARPFRAPHHTATNYALTGGGREPKPGEISLAHKGVLFLDEVPEFSKNVLEVLRQPLEDGCITISRVSASYTFPSDFMLVAAMNPCPCGYFPDFKRCSCNNLQVTKYLNKVSHPLLDRIDINVEVGAVSYDDLQGKWVRGESSGVIRERILKAQEIQRIRYGKKGYLFNSQLNNIEVEEFCRLDKSERKMLKQAFERFSLSARAYHRILKVARTIADLDGKDCIDSTHLSEAIAYRGADYKFWK